MDLLQSKKFLVLRMKRKMFLTEKEGSCATACRKLNDFLEHMIMLCVLQKKTASDSKRRKAHVRQRRKETDHHSSEMPVPQWDQERPDQLHQDQVPDQRCLHPGAHLHLGFLQSAEIQPRGVSVVISPLRQMQCLAFAQNVRSCCSNVTESQQVKTRSMSQLPSSKPPCTLVRKKSTSVR